jgi:hypothetical protein
MKHQAVWFPLASRFSCWAWSTGTRHYGLAAAFLVVSAGIAIEARQQNKPR